MTTEPPLSPAVLDNIEAYQNAVTICRLVLTDGNAIGRLWANLTLTEQMNTALAMAICCNDMIAATYVLGGIYLPGQVPLDTLIQHHDQYLVRLATAFDQPATPAEEPQ